MNIVKYEKTLVVPKAFADAVRGFYEDMVDCDLGDYTYEILEAIIDEKNKVDDVTRIIYN